MQPDIEIYLLSCPTDKIVSWLSDRFTLLEKQPHHPFAQNW